MTVHRYTTSLNSLKRAPGQTSGAGEDTEGHTEVADPATGAAQEGPGPRETTGTVLRLHVVTAAHGPTEQEKNAEPHSQECLYCGRLGHFSKVCKQKPNYHQSDKTAVKHIDTEEQPPDYFQSEYTTPYFITNEQAKAPIKCLKTTAKVHHIQDRDTEHIRPLWVAQSKGAPVLQTNCEVDTGAGCNILPAHKAQQLFGHECLGHLDKSRVHIEAYGGQSVHSLGSCVLHLHIDNKVFPTIFEVTNMPGPMILGRVQAKAMGYVQFPQIRQPHTLNAFEHTSTKWCAHKTPTTKTAETAPRAQVSVHKTTQKEITKTKQTHQTTEPVLPDIKWGSDYIQLNGKTHQLPITKDYILKEYNDVFKGVGTLPGGSILHQTKRRVQASTTPT